MSEKGNGDDNAAVETFFKTIKAELIWRHPWETRRQAEMAIFPSHRLQANDCQSMENINGFYNPRPLGILLCKTLPAMDVTQHRAGKTPSLLNAR
jgi:hypothetical protein